MTYLGVSDWERMLRTGAPDPEPEETNPYDEFADIWQNSPRGHNQAAEEWLNNRVNYTRTGTQPHNWSANPTENLPDGHAQLRETNRDIEGDRDAFNRALERGAEQPYNTQFDLGGPPPERWEPTSEERLRSDEGWLLGPNKQFDFPGGRESAADNHNGMHNRGFELENIGTDEDPVPGYVNNRTGARISPAEYDEEAPWKMSVPGAETTYHNSPVMAVAQHERVQRERADAAAARQQQQHEDYQNWVSATPGRTPTRSTSPRRSRGAPGSRPTNIEDAMRHAVGTASYLTGDDARNASWDVRNLGTDYGGHPNHIYAHSTGWLDPWVAQQYAQDLNSGKIQHVIYHHQTPLAWLKAEPGESGDPNAGDATHTWVIPDEKYSVTSSRRQRAIDWAIRATGHGDAVERPYDPARGFPAKHGGVPGGTYHSRSASIRDLVSNLAEQGFHRPEWNTRENAVFIRPTTETQEQLSPYGYPRTRVHGVYLKPTEKPAQIVGQPGEPTWTVGEHDTGTNKIKGSKRFDTLDEALAHADRMHQWIRNGADPAQHPLARQPRQRRNPAQPQLPITSSVASWSDFLRYDGGE